MSEQTHAELMAAVYPTRDQAKTILDMLWNMHRDTTITLQDAAIATKDSDGKVKIEETDELTGKEGAFRGALVVGVVGLIYPPSLIGTMLVGGVIGGLIGKFRDTGIKNANLKEIADKLEPGKSAVIALGDGQWVAQIQGALQGYDGELIIHPISEQEAKEIYMAGQKARTATS
jgi:uncharacterized membrane protein